MLHILINLHIINTGSPLARGFSILSHFIHSDVFFFFGRGGGGATMVIYPADTEVFKISKKRPK